MDWQVEIVAVAAMLAAVLGFLWNLHRDVRGLSDRVARDMHELSERQAQDMRELSERIAGDIRELAERIATDTRGLSERIARVEGLLEGMHRPTAPVADPVESPV